MNLPLSSVGQASRLSLTSRRDGARRDAWPTRWPRSAALAALVLLTLSPLQSPGAGTNATTYPIDLATALRLAGAQNLDVQLARVKVTQAQANHQVAQARFFPWLSPGLGFRRHTGNTQTVEGRIVDVDKNTYAAGLAVNAQLDLGDAIYSSLAAHQLVNAAQSGLEARQQQSSFEAASGYFDLLRAAAIVVVFREAEGIAFDYARQVSEAADAGIAFRGDAFRAEVQVERTRLELRRAREQERLASTRLAQVLKLDPAIQLEPITAELAPLTLIDPGVALDSLVVRALGHRPELQKSRAELTAARKSQSGAKYGPLIPTVGASAGFGGLGGGAGSPGPDSFASSEDYFIGLGWRIGPGGLFDRGRIRGAEAQVKTGELEAEKLRDQVTREVVDAHTRAVSLADQIQTARRALAAAEETARLTRGRKEFGVGIVLEEIQAQVDLTRARETYLSAIADFEKAQYGLQRAVGEPGKTP